jgi:hypothetical protein
MASQVYIQDSNGLIWALGIAPDGSMTTTATSLTSLPSPQSSGGSTITVQAILDRVAAKGIPTPLVQPSGYAVDLAIAMANDVMSDIIGERFNWKFNRVAALPFYTNSWQQDYPQVGITNLGWLEDADRVDINNTSMPKPIRNLTVRRQLSRVSTSWTPVAELCWMYNSQLAFGVWPGPGVIYSTLVAPQVKQNPIMSMVDKNGNLLIVTGFGTTGTTAPFAAVGAAEGVTVADGTVTWTVVAPTSQGFRVSPLPGATGPVWQIIPYYQMKALTILSLGNLINPIPDDYSRFFQKGMESYCLAASPNPADKERANVARAEWMKSMMDAAKQGDREADAYGMLPASSPVENVYAWVRNPQDPNQPY